MHDAASVSGGEIDDADELDNSVMGADRRFGVVGRNEVFATFVVEISHTQTGHCVDSIILRHREARRRRHGEVRVENLAAGGDGREVDQHTGRRVMHLGQANARRAGGRSGFRARANNQGSGGSRTKFHTIAERATGGLTGPKEANPDVNVVAGTGAQGSLRVGSAEKNCILTVAIRDDTVLGVVLDEIVARAALNRKPGIGDRDIGVEPEPSWKSPAPLVFVAPA